MAIELPPIKCGNCGALVKVKAGAKTTTCGACGAHLGVPDSLAGALPGQAVGTVVAAPGAQARKGGGGTAFFIVLGIIVVLVLLVGVGGALSWYLVATPTDGQDGKKLHWYTMQGTGEPLVVHEGQSGGSELIVGLVRRGYEADRFLVAAFDGKTFEERWRAGPFSAHGAPLKHAGHRLLATAGGHVVAATGKQQLGVLTIDGGQLANTVNLSGSVKTICEPPDGSAYVFVELDSQQHVKLEVPSGKTERMEKPEWCTKGTPRTTGNECHPEPGVYGCVPGKDVPKLDGFNPRYGIEVGTLTVAVGSKSAVSGTAVVAFEQGADKPKWDKTLEGSVRHVAVTPALFHALTIRGSELHFIALKLENGFEHFNQQMPWPTKSMARSLMLEGDRFYVARNEWLDVLDAKLGSPVGYVGRPE